MKWEKDYFISCSGARRFGVSGQGSNAQNAEKRIGAIGMVMILKDAV